MNISPATSRKILPTTLAAALAGILLVSGCTKQSDETTASEAQTDVQATQNSDNKTSSAADQAHIDRLLISYADMAHAAYKEDRKSVV